MKGVILAAGKGTRLYPVTHLVPKPLLLLANRPTIFYAFDRLREMGVTDICIVVGENELQVRLALGDGATEGVQLSYVRQTDPKGLAHAVGFAKEFVAGDAFVLYLGDAIYDRSLAGFAEKFLSSGCASLNLVKPVEDPRRFGVANVEGDRIVKLVEKPQQPESNLAMAGLYFFRTQIWDVLPDLKPSARGEFEITDAIQALVDQGETVLAGVYEGAWFDTGTLDSFLETSAHLTGGRVIISPDAVVEGEIGSGVVIGAGADVRCDSIEDSVVMPGSRVRVAGSIRHSILSGPTESDGPLQSVILEGNWKG